MNSGIYKITNTVNGRFYIGSAVNFNKRWNVHRSQMSEQQKNKIRNALTGHKVSDETRHAISESCKGLCAGSKHPMYGLPVSQERRTAQSKKMQGRYSGEKNPAARAVIKYDLVLNLLGIYTTVKTAAESVRGDNANIVNCCRGRYKTAYGYIWRYAEEAKDY